MAINATVDQLVASGDYAAAAELAQNSGDPLRAADLYERIWEFDKAALAARAAGVLDRALRAALDSESETLIDDIAADLLAAGDDGKRAALAAFADKRQFDRAAPLAEELGQLEDAARYYQEGHHDLEAARVLTDLGRDHDAGRLLERLMRYDSGGPHLAPAHLLLGKLLARRMQHDAAVRQLQLARKYDDTRREAEGMLVLELTALGLRDAARDVLVDARAADPSLPASLEEFVRSRRDSQPTATREDRDVIAGRYRLAALLGSGGAGRVYRATDEVTGKVVALKLFSTGYARGHQGYERFVREARIAASLRHPNIVESYDFSAELGYIVMELMSGSLEGRLAERQGKPMAGRHARRLLVEVLAGLEYAHQRGIIHRDVKPANIFFDARGTAKLGDFGVAHLLDLGQTQTGGLIGTLAYMSPEQITGAPLTIAADLYAVGVTLFEALTGRLPFLGPDFVAQHLGQPAAPPSRFAPIAAGWDAITLRLLEKNPDDRFESIDELRAAIAELKDSAQAPDALLIPRADAADLVPRRSAAVAPVAAAAEAADAIERYQFETVLGTSEIATISRALDTALDRSVIIERWSEPPVADDIAARLYSLARGAGPFLQRTLSFDRPGGVAVYEAPSGEPLAERTEDIDPRQAARLLKRLARAVAGLHERGGAHGRISDTTILIDESLHPALLVSGQSDAAPGAAAPSPEQDVRAIMSVVGAIVGVDGPAPTREQFLDALVPTLGPQERAAILAPEPPETGEELWRFADALEIALLKTMRREGAIL